MSVRWPVGERRADPLEFIRLAERIPDGAAVREVLALYARGQDLPRAGSLAAETAHSANRRYDLTAFTAAGRVTAARQRASAELEEGNSR